MHPLISAYVLNEKLYSELTAFNDSVSFGAWSEKMKEYYDNRDFITELEGTNVNIDEYPMLIDFSDCSNYIEKEEELFDDLFLMHIMC